MKSIDRKSIVNVLISIGLFVGSGGVAIAASSSDFNQTINSGALTSDILNASRNPVASPTVAMSAKNFSFDCQAGAGASTGTFGTNSERIYVSNPDGADNGWNLTIAATGGSTARWTNGGSNAFIDFNDPTGSTAGCSDGADTDSSGGQMTVDPSAGTLTADCSTCTTANVSKGSSASFNEGVTNNITLLSAAAASDNVWRGYLTGAGISQTIPAETPADSFSLNLTLTATAL